MWHWNGMGAWGWIMMTIIWIVVIALIVWAVRTVGGPARSDPEQAMRVLDERFARGEIDQQEYEERRRVLKDNR